VPHRIKPKSETTSRSSPGHSEKRDLLIHIYDELCDTGKQELLRLALELSAAGDEITGQMRV
jgi:hypothetical protein